MPKISGLPEDTLPTIDDYTVSVDSTSGATKKVKWANTGAMIGSVIVLPGHIITPQLVAPATIVTSTGSLNPNITSRMFIANSINASATLAAPTGGTPDDGQGLTIRLGDNGTAHSISYDPIYVGRGVTPPTTTVVSQFIYLSLAYNLVANTWDILSVGRG
jgi:hypothetical protein